jgi:trk system potassium uptake protein
LHVIIIGGGQVGTELSSRLSQDHDVVIIERNREVAKKIEDGLDVMVLEGSGASSAVLEKAGIKKANLLIAVTETDEVNIIACMLAKKFGVSKTVARIRNPEYDHDGSVLTNEQLGIDYVINPEAETAREIKKIIDFPGINEIEYYADGAIKMIGLTVKKGNPMINKPLKDLQLPQKMIICSIVRKDGEVIVPGGYDTFQAGDEVYILAVTGSIDVHTILNRQERVNHNIVIAGGGKVGLRLAELLEGSRPLRVKVKLIEKDPERCSTIAGSLNRTVVLNGDVSNYNFLKAEEINHTDVFVAVTGDDEINLLSTLLAKKLGAKHTVSEVVRPDYNIILNSIGIDKVVSPRILTAARIMRLILKGQVISLTIIKEEKAEILELILPEKALVCRRELMHVGLPKGVLVGAVSRGNKTFIPGGKDILMPGDRIVVFTLHHRIPDIERLFAAPTRTIRKIFKYS